MAPVGLEPVYDNGTEFIVFGLRQDGSSMAPTLQPEQQLLIDASAYREALPRRGDIVAFYPPTTADKPYVKRVIGLPGERVQFKDGAVLIEGQVLDEDYIGKSTVCGMSEVCNLIVPENMVYVLGDNRGNSSDSRSFGPVPLASVVGSIWYAHFDPQPLILESGI